MKTDEIKNSFFKEKVALTSTLIFFLFIFSFIFGIVLFKYFHNLNIFGATLSYFISTQATIYLSILLIFIYQKQVLKLEKKYEKLF